jgi:hypothetical protein
MPRVVSIRGGGSRRGQRPEPKFPEGQIGFEGYEGIEGEFSRDIVDSLLSLWV